ncbi:hypothetical protein H6G94_31045 [Nostoc punctiforme FACHB-252]|uniref:Uncharacterized protein n=2 Tax=Nostoc TaxID=1177 RepID=A0ABR8HJD7_NOSPU|nr:hypothetical protein [Nostoc punctiforme]MBC1238644.1 hypothetical protein [Nostoc sp. 2RC]MBD2615638.1 hypothetical protein [Nostoc punctiforme FACHB-252]
MNLPPEYPFIHVYTQQKTRQPAIVKGNIEGLCVLLNAIVNAIAYPQTNGMAEVFDGDAECYQVLIQQTSTHEELAPLPYQEEHEPK